MPKLQGPGAIVRPNKFFAVTVGLVLLLVIVALLVASRLVTVPDHADVRDQGAADHALGHVHGLGVDPADGTLYIASHLGVFQMTDPAEPPQRVADRWQDTMGFTVVGPGHFLASGHPDLTEDLPTHLGLIESRDAAVTWKALSLGGQADFHALDAAPGRTWGFDSQSGQLLTTTDHISWQPVAREVIIDLAVDPNDIDRVLATSADGRLAIYSSTGELQPVAGPPVVVVDWPRTDLLVGVSSDGRVYRSNDLSITWHRTSAAVPGRVEALEATDSGWYVATSEGLFASHDDGRSWQTLATHSE